MNKKILSIDNMIDALLRAKDQIGGDAPFAVDNDHGRLDLAINNNIIISKGALLVNASDWGDPVKDMDF